MWQIVYGKAVTKQLRKLPLSIQAEIRTGLQEHHWFYTPRRTNATFMATTSFWPVRIGNYRILCNVENNNTVDVLFYRLALSVLKKQ